MPAIEHPDARVLVTGAQGLLGREVVAGLLDAGVGQVLGTGRSPRCDGEFTHAVTDQGRAVPAVVPARLRAGLDDRYHYRQCDLTDAVAVAALVASCRPTAVVHAAAALRDSSWDALSRSNIHATAVLAEAVASVEPTARLVVVSSGSVYGPGGGMVPLREDGLVEPSEPYGVSKRAAEDAARAIAARHDLDLTVARVFNLVGAGLQERHLPALLAAHVAWAVAEPGHVLSLGPLDATRDFVDVRDAGRAVVGLALRRGGVGTPPVVNVASGIETPVAAVMTLLLDAAGRPDLVLSRKPGRSADIPRAVADVTRLHGLGLGHRIPLADSLATMLAYYLEL